MISARSLFAALSLTAACAFAQDADPSSLYQLSTEGTPSKVKAGQEAKMVLQISAKDGAHISEEAPLKVELTGTNVKLAKEKLTREDSVAKKKEGEEHVSPRFEVPFTAAAKGAGKVDVKATFFICTDKICARQQKTLSVELTAE